VIKKFAFLVFAVVLVIWKLWPVSVPPRFPQFNEHVIAGPGSYEIPQWSADSRYLAYVDLSGNHSLAVYDTETEARWNVASNIQSTHFSWTPEGNLSYLQYRSDLSGSPHPIISELHRVNLDGANDEIIASNLSSAGDFAWFGDGEHVAMLVREPHSNAIYLLNTRANTTHLILDAPSIDLRVLVTFDLAPDEQTMLIYGLHEESSRLEAQMVIYDLESQTIFDRLIPSQIIPSGNITYPPPTIGDGTNARWVGGQRWFLTSANTPGGDCYNYALYFFDTGNLQNNFCIPAIGGVFDYPTISPDLTKISYVTVVDPAQYYLMDGILPSDLLSKLGLNPLRNIAQ
jgi:hypothetical protein